MNQTITNDKFQSHLDYVKRANQMILDALFNTNDIPDTDPVTGKLAEAHRENCSGCSLCTL